MSGFEQDYLVLAVFSAWGTIQLSAVSAGLSCLQLLRSRSLSALIGLAALVAVNVWFFSSETRNLPDASVGGAGLNGSQQAVLFSLGTLIALGVSLLVSSMRRASAGLRERDDVRGLEALACNGYLSALRANLRVIRRRWRASTHTSSSG